MKDDRTQEEGVASKDSKENEGAENEVKENEEGIFFDPIPQISPLFNGRIRKDIAQPVDSPMVPKSPFDRARIAMRKLLSDYIEQVGEGPEIFSPQVIYMFAGEEKALSREEVMSLRDIAKQYIVYERSKKENLIHYAAMMVANVGEMFAGCLKDGSVNLSVFGVEIDEAEKLHHALQKRFGERYVNVLVLSPAINDAEC